MDRLRPLRTLEPSEIAHCAIGSPFGFVAHNNACLFHYGEKL
ncbi:hypothetical protein NBRC3293_2488 [Gluconobacter oxydans NBRC 3293]|uniref:Uncharacterized protein n=1 Tax=Gluconobacter oxydans NBRC 3293 TaxID=1315969 RepID=A0A829X4W0_GLUOY|nr:hypothetical protein NBRC3293_2488 [Gluconobacter oxydans NBRC 3293]